MIYFTSDLHFGHDKEFIWKARGFNSLKEMEEAIVSRWNNIVQPDDVVYILGDVMLGLNQTASLDLLYSLNGTKRIIAGNHDTANKLSLYGSVPNVACMGWATPYKFHPSSGKQYHFYLSHYPTFTANFGDDNTNLSRIVVNLHGHTHNKDKFFNNSPYMYNVGMDAHNCTPVSIDEIMDDIVEAVSIREPRDESASQKSVHIVNNSGAINIM